MAKTPSRMLALGAVLVGSLACSGAVGGNSANREACERYVAHMNGLTPCLGLSYDADNLCTGVHLTQVDMSGYYDCLTARSSCSANEPVLELDSCVPPMDEPGLMQEPG